MKLLRLLTVPFAFLCFLVMRLAWPRWKFRIGVFFSNRIGHLIGNSEVYLCERDAGMHREFIDFWTHNGAICNQQAAKMLARCMRVSGFARTVYLCNKLFPGWERHDIGAGTWDRDIHNLLEKYPPHLKFTEDEYVRGMTAMRDMGVPPDAKFVCLIARDSAYLPDLAYHGFRDTDIKTYELAALELAKRGYYVIRMGAKVAKPMLQSHHLIDYASRGIRSDFMDMYLMAHCEFCISSGTGLDAVAVAFRRQVCYVNYVPVEYLQTYNAGSLAIWKHHYKDGKRLSVPEIVAAGVGDAMASAEFERAGVTLVDNTPEEIRDAAIEMISLSVKDIHFSEPLNQDGFWRAFPRNISPYNNKPLHGEIRMRVGSHFLRNEN